MNLIPHATNAKAVSLIEVVADHIGIVVAQSADPSEARTVLCTNPPETGVANVGVRAIEAAVTAREACESTFIRGLLVG